MTMTTAFMFPGQGSQSVGMLAALAAEHTVVGHTFAEASAVLGYDLWKLVSEGPVEELNATERTQPAMLTAGIATWRVWQSLGGATPDLVCGHSLGEYSALVAANVIDFPAAVALVRLRGELMQQAVPVGQGGIAAVLGLEDAEVVAACAEAAGAEVVEAVNFNSPGQVVIAGHASAVERAMAACKARGAKRAVLLPMSVPAHSPLMQPAGERFAVHLATLAMRDPSIGFCSPVDGARHDSAAAIRSLMQRQLASPVRWSQLVQGLVAGGTQRFVECGPGKVLAGLVRRIDKRPEVQTAALEDVASLTAALAATGA
jgi:[acyl-carrier-protein] S-malonyltransferase